MGESWQQPPFCQNSLPLMLQEILLFPAKRGQLLIILIRKCYDIHFVYGLKSSEDV